MEETGLFVWADLFKIPLTFVVGFCIPLYQLRKIKAEIVNLTTQHVLRRRDVSEAFSDADLACAEAIDELRRTLAKGSSRDDIDLARTHAAGLLVNKRVSRFISLADFWVHGLGSKKDEVDTYFERHIFVEMEKWIGYLTVFNLPELLEKYNFSHVFISVQTMDRLRELSSNASDTQSCYAKFDDIMNRVLEAGAQPPFTAS